MCEVQTINIEENSPLFLFISDMEDRSPNALCLLKLLRRGSYYACNT